MTFSPIISGIGLGAFDYLQRTRDQQVERLEASPEVARDLAAFREQIADVKTPDDLLNNRSLLKVALGAFGLEEDLGNIGFLRNILESDLNDERSMVNRLADRRYQEFASAFNFSGGTPQIPSNSPVPALQARWDRLDAPEDLFKFVNTGLLNASLEAFDLTDDKDRTVFLTQVLKSDVDDPTSLVNRLDDKRYLAFARAYQGVEAPVSDAFLEQFDSVIQTRLQGLGSAQDLLDDRGLLRSVLDAVGLTGTPVADNRFVLEQVMQSDLNDPDSFVNRLNDPRLVQLAEAFDFNSRNVGQLSVYDFAETFEGKVDGLTDAEQLLGDDTLLNAALRVFGLDASNPDKTFLASVLNSDLDDPASVANSQSNPMYVTFAKAFGFGEMLKGSTQDFAQDAVSRLVDTVSALASPSRNPEDVALNFGLLLSVQTFFDVPTDLSGLQTVDRLIRSDPSFEGSLLNNLDDARYQVLYRSLDLDTAQTTERVYPKGFAENLIDSYLERTFEVAVGAQDQNLRVALAAERELGDLVAGTRSDTARWFSVLASGPLNSLFQTALSIPASSSSLSPERQIEDMQDRARALFGTDDLGALSEGDLFEDLRSRFLNLSQLNAANAAAPTNAGAGYSSALAVLSSAATPGTGLAL